MSKKAIILVKLGKILESKGMTQGTLCQLTGLRPSTISKVVCGSRSVLNKDHLAKIIEILEITDIGDIIEIDYILNAQESTE
ncbi:helix-turn-helix domain-containing protein [Paenibacillus terrae]|uniref:helix-turn-helix domain-containing protein n=1 Tax=Paenibacillus terrae TaxID=159743 RepID=UPI0016568A10|nr:helix-turn-helix transcriptional regulator [Paenibacillus terrae]